MACLDLLAERGLSAEVGFCAWIGDYGLAENNALATGDLALLCLLSLTLFKKPLALERLPDTRIRTVTLSQVFSYLFPGVAMVVLYSWLPHKVGTDVVLFGTGVTERDSSALLLLT